MTDRVFPGCVNTKSEKPYTLAVVDLAGRPRATAKRITIPLSPAPK